MGPAVLAAVLGVTVLGGCGSRHGLKTAPPAPVTSSSSTTTTIPTVAYAVKAGDTMGGIAQRFGVSVASITAANHITDPNKLTQGQVLVVPLPPLPPSTTVTTAPPPNPLKLTVSPPDGQLGAVFTFNLSGAKPGESVTFQVDSPDGRKFTGQAHTPGPDGKVTATYLVTEQNVPGTYAVIVTGSLADSVRGSFRVDAPGSATTTTSTTR